MQKIRGTRDILPSEIQAWQKLYTKALKILTLYDYSEIRTPIIEPTELFLRGIGHTTDIVNKEMYSFVDQGKRNITLRPEGTASIARAFITNKLYQSNQIQRLWYMGPMFRYERPQSGRQRQFHQLGIECIGSASALADVEVIKIAHNILQQLECKKYTIEINSIGNQEEREKYKEALVYYIKGYENDLDIDSKKRLDTNPLRILDSKNVRTQKILQNAPCLNKYLEKESRQHFELVCEYLNILEIPYRINTRLVRGLDYYNYTAFEIIDNNLNNQTICGGGRYDHLIKQLGGPNTPAVGWAIGIERLLLLINQTNNFISKENRFYIVTQGSKAQKKVWHLINLLEQHNIKFHIDLSNQSFQKQIKKANQCNMLSCLILGDAEIEENTITVKWLKEYYQETILYNNIINYIHEKSKIIP
uniref:histidine tRNA synthetase n=1 Tax=Lithothamnion corallioides TaxID=1277934 RepID=UPI0023F199DF|nr:histidine tRNA synthetase [Lithothamnion corallioides]WEA76985.1 histidine tRNA synthetase [Lithothamnion corallioides]